MQLYLMEALTMPRIKFINVVNQHFRKWARKNGASSGIAMALPTRTTGSGVLPRQQVVPSNLHLYEQRFDCVCGYHTHIAGQFHDHVQSCSTIAQVTCA